MKKKVGLVKWFDPNKGFGVLKSLNEEEVFMHRNDFKRQIDGLEPSTALMFELKDNSKRLEGKNCYLPNLYEDFRDIMDLLDKVDSVTIEIEVSGRGPKGNPYRRRENQLLSIKGCAVRQLFQKKGKEEIVTLVTRYYDEEVLSKKPELFFAYAIFIKKRLQGISIPSMTGALKEIFTFFDSHKNNNIIFQAWANNDPSVFNQTSFSEELLTPDFFRENARYLKSEYVPRIQKLQNANSLLLVLFSFWLDKFLAEKSLKQYRLVAEIIDAISNNEIKQDSNRKLAADKNLITEIVDDYILLDIGKRTADLDILKLIIDNWKNEHTSLTLPLLRLLKDCNFNQQDIPQSLLEKFANEATLYELKSCLEFLQVALIVNAVITKLDFLKDGVFSYLSLVPNISDYSLLIEEKISKSIKDLQEDFSYHYLSKIVTIVKSPNLKIGSESLLIEIDSLAVSNLHEFLKDSNNGQTITTSLQYSKIIDTYNKCKECLSFENSRKKIQDRLEAFLYENANRSVIIKAWEQGILLSFPKYLSSNLGLFTNQELTELFNTQKLDRNEIKAIFDIRKADPVNSEWVLQIAAKYLSQEERNVLDEFIFQSIAAETYYGLWKRKIGKLFPASYIKRLLKENISEIYQVQNWLKNELCTQDQIGTVILELLSEFSEVSDRQTFYLRFNCIKCLADLKEDFIKTVLAAQNDFDKLILWFLERTEHFNFKLLQKKFIYFNPADQVKIVKRLFHLKNIGELDFTINDLENITKADLDLFLTNEKFNSDFVLDISTSLIIEIIKNYQLNGVFLADSQLLKVVLHDIGKERKKKFKIESYFEDCSGRMVAEWDWKSNGKIFKQSDGQNYFFIIEFEYSPTLVDAVKSIPGRRYDSASKNWIIPSSSEQQVLEFGRANRFFFNFGSNHYSNNPHLAKFHRDEVPNGIKFCEGRIAVNQDDIFQRSFWWCANQKCFQNCETNHLSGSEYSTLTLLDFLRVLVINVDENSQYGFFPNGKYYHLVTQINRFNRLLERMYCHECDEILFPVQSSNFAAYTVVRFSCQNNNCREHGKEVYLNHCLDGKCNSIIDSRVSKQCENGLYICNFCGGCCSHEMLNRRLTNLRTTGGSIHPSLINCMENQKGHREKNEYFCYKCSTIMAEVIDDINRTPNFFKCLECQGVEYRPQSTIKRPHLHLRRSNYPQVNLSDLRNRNNGSTFPDFDLGL